MAVYKTRSWVLHNGTQTHSGFMWSLCLWGTGLKSLIQNVVFISPIFFFLTNIDGVKLKEKTKQKQTKTNRKPPNNCFIKNRKPWRMWKFDFTFQIKFTFWQLSLAPSVKQAKYGKYTTIACGKLWSNLNTYIFHSEKPRFLMTIGFVECIL